MIKSTETDVAVLQTQMQEVKTSLEAIKSEQHSNFISIIGKIDSLANTPMEISVINKRLLDLEATKNRDWIWKTLSAAAGAILALLVAAAITKK